MPLVDPVPGQTRLQRIRVFVDSADRDPELSLTRHRRVVIPLPEGRSIENVQAVELVGFNYPRSCIPMFVADTADPETGQIIPGNNRIVIRFTVPSYSISRIMTVTVPPFCGRFSLLAGGFLNEAIITAIRANVPELAHLTMTNGFDGTLFAGGFRPSEAWGTVGWISMYRVIVDGGRVANSLEILFSDEANKEAGNSEPSASPAEMLGFPAGSDNLAFEQTGGPIQSFPLRARGYTYMDVRVRELPTEGPLARISLVDNEDTINIASKTELDPDYFNDLYIFLYTPNLTLEDPDRFATRREPSSGVRFLREPVSRLSRLTLDLTYEGGVTPQAEFEQDWDLVLDLLVVVPLQEGQEDWAAQAIAL